MQIDIDAQKVLTEESTFIQSYFLHLKKSRLTLVITTSHFLPVKTDLT